MKKLFNRVKSVGVYSTKERSKGINYSPKAHRERARREKFEGKNCNIKLKILKESNRDVLLPRNRPQRAYLIKFGSAEFGKSKKKQVKLGKLNDLVVVPPKDVEVRFRGYF